MLDIPCVQACSSCRKDPNPSHLNPHVLIPFSTMAIEISTPGQISWSAEVRLGVLAHEAWFSQRSPTKMGSSPVHIMKFTSPKLDFTREYGCNQQKWAMKMGSSPDSGSKPQEWGLKSSNKKIQATNMEMSTNQYGVWLVIFSFQPTFVFSFHYVWDENHQPDIRCQNVLFPLASKPNGPRPTNELQRRHVQPRFCPGKWKGWRHIPCGKHWFQGHVH